MHVRSLGYRTDLALLTASGSTVEDRGTHLVVRTPENPNYHWGNFLLLDRAPVPGGEKEVVGAFRTEFPEATHVAIGIDASPHEGTQEGTPEGGALDADARARFEAAGLRVSDDVVLACSTLVQPLSPLAAITVRPLVSEEDWEQRTRLDSLIDPGSDPETHAAYQRGRNDLERSLARSGAGQRFGAFLDDTLVATAAVFRTEATLARYQNVETHPDHRRQGIGAAVVHAAGRYALGELGVERLVIVAEAEGPAIGIYRRLGFVESETQIGMELAGPDHR